MTVRILALGIAALAAMAVTPAVAQNGAARSSDCSLRISTSATNWIIQGYDLFGSSTPVATFDAVFSNDGGSACVFDPIMSLEQDVFGLTTSGRQERVAYTLLNEFTNSNATPVAGRTIVRVTGRPVTVPPGGQQLVRYQLAVEEDNISGDGLYSQNITLIAQSRQHDEVLATRPLVIGINVLPSAVLGLSGSYRRNGGQALVDLGELKEGPAKVPLQIRVSSTRAYRLDLSSKNAGQLMSTDAAWSIPYKIGVGDTMLSLSSNATYISTNRQPTNNDALPLQFVIGDVRGKRAGQYSDVVTISIAPN